MQKKISALLIANRRFTIFFVTLLILGGIYSYYIIPKQENPDVSAPVAVIQTIYPGASAEDVEKLVTTPVEEKCTEVPGYDFMHSYSKNSVSFVILQLNFDADEDQAWEELRQKIDDLQADLPDGCYQSEIDTNLAHTPGMIISLSGENYSYEQLSEFAESYKKRLSKIEGVKRFEVDGKVEKQVAVEVDTALLNQRRLSLDDLVTVLKAQNIDIPSGSIETESGKINVRVPGTFASLQEIENSIIDVSAETGAVVRVKDIASVYWDLDDSSVKIRQNRENAVLLTGFFEDNRNIILVGDEVRTELDRLRSEMPPDLKVEEALFEPKEVQDSIGEFVGHLLLGMVLVILVVFLGMGLRNAVVASTAVPLSILITFIVMHVFGLKVEQISITALIIALGMLVDDAIVIVDAIQVHIDNGMGKLESCIEGSSQAAVPVFTSTLVAMVAFAPLLNVPGPAGEYMRAIPLVVIISLAASYGVAMLITPAISYLVFRDRPPEKEKKTLIQDFFNALMERGMNHRRQTVLIALGCLAVALLLITQLTIRFFPNADKNLMYVDMYSERPADLEATEALAAEVESLLAEQPEVSSMTTAVGDGLPKFFISMKVTEATQDFAQTVFRIDMEEGGRFDNKEDFGVYLQEQMDQRISGGQVRVKQLEQAFPYTAVTVRVQGDDLERIREVAMQIKDKLQAMPGTLNVADDYDQAVYEYNVEVDTDYASQRGFSAYDIQKQINIALRGAESSVYRKGGKEFAIIVKSDIKSKEELENLGIKSSATGEKVLLKQIADVDIKPVLPTIKKYRGDLSIAVTSDVMPEYVPVKMESDLQAAIAGIDTEGVELFYDGERKQITDNFGELGYAALFSLVLIYFILMLQFKSFVEPLVIFGTIPLAIIGAVMGLLIFRQPMSFTALLGMAGLMGLVVKNAILLLDYVDHARREGADIDQACRDAVNRRCRPVLLTAVTAIIGLTPLAVSGSDLFMPMAVTIMAGLALATLLTMVVIPVVYSLVQGRLVPGVRNRLPAWARTGDQA